MSEIYGLFKITFDYYCWEDLIAVSESEESLSSHYKDIEKLHYGYPIYSHEKSSEIRGGRSEEFHFVIMKVKRV